MATTTFFDQHSPGLNHQRPQFQETLMLHSVQQGGSSFSSIENENSVNEKINEAKRSNTERFALSRKFGILYVTKKCLFLSLTKIFAAAFQRFSIAHFQNILEEEQQWQDKYLNQLCDIDINTSGLNQLCDINTSGLNKLCDINSSGFNKLCGINTSGSNKLCDINTSGLNPQALCFKRLKCLDFPMRLLLMEGKQVSILSSEPTNPIILHILYRFCHSVKHKMSAISEFTE